jgi:hypothetical protein
MSFEPKQIEMVCLEDLVSSTHIYRKFLNLWNLDLVRLELERLEAESRHKGMGSSASSCACCCSFLKIYLIASWKDLSLRTLQLNGFANSA